MKTSYNTMRWLGLAVTGGIIAFAGSADAKRPVQPPPEPPPPAGPAYLLVSVDTVLRPLSIADSGTLVGTSWYEYSGGGFQAPAKMPAQIIDGLPHYVTNDLVLLPDVDGEPQYGECIAANAYERAIGYIDDVGFYRSTIWLPNGAPIDISTNFELPSVALDINDSGVVLVGVGYMDQEGEGVVLVLPDTDGASDLIFTIDIGHGFLPIAINENNQVLLSRYFAGSPVEGYLLTPDPTDADGDGNPWYADGNDDGFNDLLVYLEPPVEGETVSVAGMNNAGQIAGSSGGHAVRWDFVDGAQIITDLGVIADKAVMTVKGIDDSGRIVGTSKVPTGRRTKTGPSWLSDGDTLYELPPLMVNGDWSTLTPRGINSAGWICGLGWVAVPVEQP